jgi:hypothetical protein
MHQYYLEDINSIWKLAGTEHVHEVAEVFYVLKKKHK